MKRREREFRKKDERESNGENEKEDGGMERREEDMGGLWKWKSFVCVFGGVGGVFGDE